MDLAAGTGRLTRALLAAGASVTAVEPVDEMRALIQGTASVKGTAEDIPLEDASADAVFVGQAFHWFDVARALPEIARVLRPGGGLAAMWNIGQPQGDAWRTEVLELVREIDMDPERRRVLSQAGAEETAWRHGGEWELFEPLERREFEHTQRMTADEYVTFVSSWSFVAIIEEPQRTELLTAVAGVLDRHGVSDFDQRWRTDLWLTRRLPNDGTGGEGT